MAPSLTAAEMINEFGAQHGLTNKWPPYGRESDADTTDGSSVSDNEASCSSDAASPQNDLAGWQAPPSQCSFLVPQVVSRRSALRQAGQKVLVSISHPARAPAVGAASKTTKSKQRPQATSQSNQTWPATSPALGYQGEDSQTTAQYNQAWPATPPALGYQGEDSQATSQYDETWPATPPALGYQGGDSGKPNEAIPQALPKPPPFLEPEFLKVESVTISEPSKGTALVGLLDPSLPVKKRPIFVEGELGAPSRSFEAMCPLKKRVSDFLLQEPERVVAC